MPLLREIIKLIFVRVIRAVELFLGKIKALSTEILLEFLKHQYY